VQGRTKLGFRPPGISMKPVAWASGVTTSVIGSAIYAIVEKKLDLLLAPFKGVSLGVLLATCLFLLSLTWLATYASFAYRQQALLRTFGKLPLVLCSSFSLFLTCSLLAVSSRWAIWNPPFHEAAVVGATLMGLLVFVTTLTLAYLRVMSIMLQAATTASGIVLSRDNHHFKVLLVFNQRFKWWLPPGGHFDWSYGESPLTICVPRRGNH